MRRIFLSGRSRLPQGIPARDIAESLALSVECEDRWGVILSADCTLATELGRHFIRDLFVGWSLEHDVPELARLIQEHYHGAAQRALLAALRDLDEAYVRYRRTVRPEHSDDGDLPRLDGGPSELPENRTLGPERQE